jgi:hypothetical protein
LIRKSIIPVPRVGDERRRTERQEDERDREEERKWRPGG